MAGVVVASTSGQDAAVIQMVNEGTSLATARVHSGCGTVTEDLWLKKNDGGVLETQTVDSVCFSGDKYRREETRVCLKNEAGVGTEAASLMQPGSRFTKVVASDGEELTVYMPESKKATKTNVPVGKAPNQRTAMDEYMQYKLRTELIIHGGLTIANMDEFVAYPPSKDAVISDFQVVSRETLYNDECIIVERTVQYSGKSGQTVLQTWRFWIDPDKGYLVPLIRQWIQTDTGEKHLTDEIKTEIQQYDGFGLWISQVTESNYRPVKGSDQYELKSKTVTKIDPAFKFNSEVASDKLMLVLPPGTEVHDESLDASYTMP